MDGGREIERGMRVRGRKWKERSASI